VTETVLCADLVVRGLLTPHAARVSSRISAGPPCRTHHYPDSITSFQCRSEKNLIQLPNDSVSRTKLALQLGGADHPATRPCSQPRFRFGEVSRRQVSRPFPEHSEQAAEFSALQAPNCFSLHTAGSSSCSDIIRGAPDQIPSNPHHGVRPPIPERQFMDLQ